MGLYCPWITIVLPLGKISRERGIERERDRIEERGHYVAAAFTLPNCLCVRFIEHGCRLSGLAMVVCQKRWLILNLEIS